jgi:threonine aldolase
MNFRSDNVGAIAPRILDAIVAANARSVVGYGADEITGRLDGLFGELFETEVRVLPALTGTAANALALAVLTPPYGAIYCHEAAHIQSDECGAPELFSGGAKLALLPGAQGMVDPTVLSSALADSGVGDVHHVQPAALSLTQQTETGGIYGIDHLAALADVAHAHEMMVHMDGARFANAVAALDCAPADITWRAGVDVLSFGATKGGAMAAEAIVLFRTKLADPLAYHHKRAGQLVSKMRFVSAQLEAYLADGLWLELARHANAMTASLARGLAALPGVRVEGVVEGNELFVTLPEAVIKGIEAEGAGFYRWPENSPTSPTIRLVCAHDTTEADVDALVATAQRYF